MRVSSFLVVRIAPEKGFVKRGKLAGRGFWAGFGVVGRSTEG
jgi:hypothetical protein